MAAELLHADRQTDRRDEASSRFSQVCERRYTCTTKRKINSKCRKSLKSAEYLIDPNFKNSEVEIKYEYDFITKPCKVSYEI